MKRWLISPPKRIINYKVTRDLLIKMRHGIENPSCEHCIPKSIIKKFSDDIYNLTILEEKANQLRSNYKLVSCLENKKMCVQFQSGGRWTIDHRKRVCQPAETFRGRYARAIGYTIALRPELSSLIFRRVISPETLLAWNHQFPPDLFETEVSEKGLDLQGNRNELVFIPDLLDWIIKRL
jgi:endonuclease I